jgi:hypothetical protein
MPMPFRFWPQVAAGASTAASVIVVPLPWSVMVVVAVVVYVACCYHICRIHILVAVSALSSVSWSGIDPSGERCGLLIDDGF